MAEQRHPEPSVEQLMRQIHAEVERRRAERSPDAGPAISEPPPPAPARPAGLPRADLDAPAPVQLRLQEPEGLKAQPEFQYLQGDRCQIGDLMPYQGRGFVSAAYRALLRRAPDEDGMHHHLENLRRGVSKIEILGDIRYSAEGRRAAVQVEGLAWAYAVEKACHLPFLGSPISLCVEFLQLPQLRRRLRFLENRVIELAEQASSRNEIALRQVQVALRELESACNRLVAHAALNSELAELRATQAAKADQTALDEARRLLLQAIDAKADQSTLDEARRLLLRAIDAKADQSTLDEARRLLRQAIDAKADQSTLDEMRELLRRALDVKAGREELTALTNYLVDLVQKRLSKTDLDPLERSVARLTESVSNVEEAKADRMDLDRARRDAAAAAQAVLEQAKQSIQSMAASKADRAAVETAQAAVKAALEDFSRSIESLSGSKADRVDLEGARHDAAADAQSVLQQAKQSIQSMAASKADRAAVETAQAAVKEALEDFSRSIESLSGSKADRADLEGARRDAAAAAQAALQQAKESIQSMAAAKADRAAVDTAQAKIVKDLGSLRHETLGVVKASLEPMTQETRGLKRGLLDQQRRLAAFLKEARKRLPKPISTWQIQAMVSEESHLLDSFYADFEDRFRGTRADIRQRQSVYLPYIRSAKAGTARAPIVDLGCGRGEWLELLRDEGLKARGADVNRVFLDACRRMKLTVDEQDAIEFLRHLKTGSVGAVTAFHLIEHLPHRTMLNLFDETLRVLRPGGMVIFETPNPENIVVGACTFYSDPTHLNPLPPEPTRFMLEARGFTNTEIKRLHGDESFHGGDAIPPRIANLFSGARDYALIGRKAQR